MSRKLCKVCADVEVFDTVMCPRCTASYEQIPNRETDVMAVLVWASRYGRMYERRRNRAIRKAELRREFEESRR